MISRYTRPELIELWSDRHRYETWLRVELAACVQMEAAGSVPAGTAAAVRGQGRREARSRAHPGARGADQARRHRLPDPRRRAGRRAGALAAPGDDLLGRAGRGAGGNAGGGGRSDTGRPRSPARRLPPPGRGAPRDPRHRPLARHPRRADHGGVGLRRVLRRAGSGAGHAGRGAQGDRGRQDRGRGRHLRQPRSGYRDEGAGRAGPPSGDRTHPDRGARSPRRLFRGAVAHRHRRRTAGAHGAPLAAHRGR